jgi:hypothetical protein
MSGLKPRNILQAAEADLKRRERNVKRYQGELSSEVELYAFYGPHVRRAKNVGHLLELAIKHGAPKSKKKNTILIYGDVDLLIRALTLFTVGS